MTLAQKMTALILEFCEGRDQEVAAAPDITFEQMMEWARSWHQKPMEQRLKEATPMVYAIGKALKSGRLKYLDSWMVNGYERPKS
jgi:hypothetical protein